MTDYAKETLDEVGIGSVPCETIWESSPNDEGSFAWIGRAEDGRVFVSISDMENMHGAYLSARISPECLEKLRGPSVKFYRDNKPLLVASDFEHVGGGVAND